MRPPLKHVLAENLRDCRLKAGLTQTDLARKAGTPQSRLALMESKKSPALPGLEWLARVAQALGVNVVDLLAEKAAPEARTLSSLPEDEENLAAHLKEWGAPLTGSAKKGRAFSPEAVVLGVLRAPSARLLECLPAVLAAKNMDYAKLLRLAEERGLVNRLGFVVDVARRVASDDRSERGARLERFSKQLWLKRNREREDFLTKTMPDDGEFRSWLKKKTPAAGKRWRVYGAYSLERFRDAFRAAA